jgi:CHAT domain-containing protein
VIESLKIAELANFFRNDCLTARANDITRIDQTAAVMYIIPLEDRLEVILNLPNGKLKRYTTTLPIAKLQHQVNTFQMYVQDESSQDYLKPAQTLYNWTIRPLESDLKEFKIRTLVIVSDPMLRGIPFAALHDGKKFLVEKYYLAASPGLQLLDSQMITRKQVNVLVSGLTKARHNFTPLPSVSVELEKIQSRVGKSTINVLLNETFTSENLASSLQSYPYSVVHIATHGNFSSKAANTFIIAWDRKINIEQLHQILRVRGRDQANPLEILILSACETAKGDKRSTLGLAGIAVRAGARSTIGSLWPVSDTSTSILMAGLYEKLADGRTSRAEALQFGQLELLNGKDETFRHPYYWSAFVLLGNWQ